MSGSQKGTDMVVHFRCGECGVLLDAGQDEALSGVGGPCPGCGSAISVQLSRTVAAEAEAGLARAAGAGRLARRRQRQWRLTSGALALASAAAVAALAFQGMPGQSVEAPAAAAARAEEQGNPVEEARSALGAFLSAPDWAGRRPWVLRASQLEGRAQAYYQGRDPEEVSLRDFKPVSLRALDGRSDIVAFRADRPGRTPALAVLQRSDAGWKVDWELFAQTYDETFHCYLRQPAYALQIFRVRLSRNFHPASVAGLYRLDVEDELDPGQKVIVELPEGSLLRDQVAAGLVDGQSRPATVELCWYRDDAEGGGWRPALQGLVCWGWLGLGAEMPSAPGERPGPVLAGRYSAEPEPPAARPVAHSAPAAR